MTALDLATDAPRAYASGFPARSQRVTKMYRALKNRREFYRLGEMTDAELRDIGLTRSDLLSPSTAPRHRSDGAARPSRSSRIDRLDGADLQEVAASAEQLYAALHHSCRLLVCRTFRALSRGLFLGMGSE